MLLLTSCAPEPQIKPQTDQRNLFAEYLGKSQQETDAKVEDAFQQLFYGDDESERIYYPVGDDMAYIWDVGSDDVRSEGMSYGMMIAVQLDKKDEFDRLWKWSHTYMRLHEGPFEGYFNWQNATSGEKISPGSASDGEEWFAMALFFASNLWGDGEGIFNYRAEANNILREMLHKQPSDPKMVSIFDYERHMVRFVPWTDWDGVTDASYHLPAFYELWAKWADSDNDYWAKTADVSREFFKTAAHPETGLMPDYSYYKETERQIGSHADFRFDAWRVMPNVALDHDWWGKDAQWQTMQSDRILKFLGSHLPDIPNQFAVDGTPLDTQSSPGLYAMAATAGLAANRDVAEPFVQRLWDQPVPTGHWRYYDGVIHMLGLLQTSGHFKIIE
ncbi:Glycosyl hydrolases family 8 [Verrucomicrobiia bacterium DG1235]|nr:Glycosyl hydrolases family 8 [Verrucomicrobiae bacterium DG1235]